MIALKVLAVVICVSWNALAVKVRPAPFEPKEKKEKLSTREYDERKQRIIEFVDQRLREKKVVKTTKGKSGETIDWIPRESQVKNGKIANPPGVEISSRNRKNFRDNKALNKDLPEGAPERDAKEGEAKTELQMDASLRGPKGTVPVVRFDLDKYFKTNPDYLPRDPSEVFTKAPPPDPASNDRYYAYWQHRNLDNYGSLGRINIWNVTGPVNDETSIAQVAVIRGSPMQAIEAGKIEHTYFSPSNRPTFFTYFRTSGSASGDNVGGYNALVDGWVQYSGTVAPGMSLVNWESTTGGTQYTLDVEVRLWQGNWWVKAASEWAGYYPETLFSSSGIRDKADRIDWYGEVYDSSAPAATSTDMGSGKFANQGWGQAAYFRNMAYFWSSTYYWWFTSGSVVTMDSNCYSSSGPFYSSNSAYRNWFYYGGPGKEAAGCT